jgi:hypothetical protein
MNEIRLSENEERVLAALASPGIGYCMNFAAIGDLAKLDRRNVRRACRSLRRKGLAEFQIGLWTEDGGPAGSGYSANKAGRDRAKASLVEQYREASRYD